MASEGNDIVFIIVASIVVIALMLFVVVDLFLSYKNRQLKFNNELLALNSKFQNEMLSVKNEVSEQIFNDISSELHDNICQTLSLAVIQINQAEAKNGIVDDHTSNSRNSIRQALEDIRNLSHNLSGEYWKNFDIHQYLKQVKDRIMITESISTSFSIDPDIQFGSKDHEIIVIRILQELINNSIKHSRANLIDLLMTTGNDGVNITYYDNGIGIDENKVSDGMGMLSIKQRLSILNASYKIESENQKGFSFQSLIPKNN